MPFSERSRLLSSILRRPENPIDEPKDNASLTETCRVAIPGPLHEVSVDRILLF